MAILSLYQTSKIIHLALDGGESAQNSGREMRRKSFTSPRGARKIFFFLRRSAERRENVFSTDTRRKEQTYRQESHCGGATVGVWAAEGGADCK